MNLRHVKTLACALLLAAGAAQAQTATLTIDAGKPGANISPHLFGVFFEEINHAGDGGLYAELVRNRSLEDNPTMPDGWMAVGNASLALDDGATGRGLRLTTPAPGAGVANGGYWGIAAEKGAKYDFSLHARGVGPLTVSLQDQKGKVYAQQKIAGLTDGWRRFSGTLTAHADDPSARLVITADRPGTVWLDTVSLFPRETFNKRPNGLRADLASMVAGMKPAFVRFPGGCFVEGQRIENAFRWKDTLGDIAQRPGHLNDVWNYRSSDGLGYHEYLQMCEDLRAAPLFVVNCGMSHTSNIPLENIDVWVQDALDAIEYANGPVTSKWGALRAKHGHPKPFHLQYIEVGNENGGAAYAERYARFYDAIRARFPDVKIVADVWGGTPNSRPFDLIDEHYYNSPNWFLAHADHYDSYARSGPKIYVGEYAVTSGAGQGNLRAALAEAAWMIGLERNADVVSLASYAPLFVNVNDRKWNPDAIAFDSARAFGTPSYYTQKLFGQNKGDVVLPVTLATPAPVFVPSGDGGIGLGTWRTQAEYKDIALTDKNGKAVPVADFAQWKTTGGAWKMSDGAYQQAADGENRRALAPGPGTPDGTLTLKARKLGGDEGFLVLFRTRNAGDWQWWNIGGWSNTQSGVEGSGTSQTVPRVPCVIETGRWYDIKIVMDGPRIQCFLDGKLIHDVTDKPAPTFFAGASRINKEIIVKIVNAGDAPLETIVNVNGAGKLDSTATGYVLTGNPADENSLAAPTKVAPQAVNIPGIGPQFTRTFPPHSLTVLRLKAK